MSRQQLSSGWLSQILKTGYSLGGIYVTDQVISMVLVAAVSVLSPALSMVGILGALLVTVTKSIRPSDVRLVLSLLRGCPSWKDLLLSILARRTRLAGFGSRMSRTVQQQQEPLAAISTSKTAYAGVIAAGVVVLAGTYMIRPDLQRFRRFIQVDQPLELLRALSRMLPPSRYDVPFARALARLRDQNKEVLESNNRLQRDMQQAAQREAQIQQQLQETLRLLQTARNDIAELEGEAERHAMFRPFWLRLALLPDNV